MSLLAWPSSSTLPLSSWLTVVSSSLIDCSSSRLVSSSSVAERSSSFIACSSSLLALSSSVEASYCSTVSRRCAFSRSSSRSRWRRDRVGADAFRLGGGLGAGARGARSITRNRSAPTALTGVDADLDCHGFRRPARPGSTTTSEGSPRLRRLVQGRAQLDAQAGVHGAQQVAARLAAAVLQEAARAGRQVEDVVFAVDQDRRRRHRFEQLEVQFAPGGARTPLGRPGRGRLRRRDDGAARDHGPEGSRMLRLQRQCQRARPRRDRHARRAAMAAARRCGSSCPPRRTATPRPPPIPTSPGTACRAAAARNGRCRTRASARRGSGRSAGCGSEMRSSRENGESFSRSCCANSTISRISRRTL